MSRSNYVGFVLFGVVLGVTPTSGQRANPDTPSGFEVASIKPSEKLTEGVLAELIRGRSITVQPGGRWVAQYATLRQILQTIYPDYATQKRIVGGPAWVDSQRFDIAARTTEVASPQEIAGMARQLVADRFNLRLSTAVRPIDVYSLMITRNDGKLGPGMGRAVNCERGPMMDPDRRPTPSSRQSCKLLPSFDRGVQVLSAGASPIADLITWLQFRADRPIVDRTGLTGEYAVRLEVPPFVPLHAMPAGQTLLPDRTDDLFTAVREQLGLSLVPRQEPMTVLIIEHVEMPRPN